jgi:hypothetical protein
MTTSYESADAFANLLQKGFGEMIGASKNVLELTVRHNAETLEATRKMLNLQTDVPGLFLFDVAGKSLENFASLQHDLLNILGEQGAAATEAVREIGKPDMNFAASAAKGFEGSVERTAAVQEAILDFAALQNKQVVDIVKQQTNVAGTPIAKAAESIQQGMEVLIEAQKKSLKIAAGQLKSTTKVKTAHV